jgi:hypothetical protein
MMQLSRFSEPITVDTVILTGIVDARAFGSTGGKPRGISTERHTGGLLVGQRRYLHNGWVVYAQMLLAPIHH